MKKPHNRRLAIEMPILCVCGILLWRLTSRNTGGYAGNSVPDLCFAVGSVFLIRGIIALLGQSHAFSLTADSFRFVHRLYRGKKNGEETEEPRQEPAGPDRRIAPVCLILGGILSVISVLAGIL